MTQDVKATVTLDLFTGSGEMRRVMQLFNWLQTLLALTVYCRSCSRCRGEV
ncbi:hypothetical protein AB0758_49425 [Tolypothrix bouteillei VB521301_2]|uniref:hypothetical protein n=1 Tax=Tolypothrix bouteillei TaxID=1246981 RepID=UPI00128FD8CD